ncbi:MAG: FAD-binding protein [Campylobacter sp.]|nr:FAD-binding protein [Campylobacter sp.]
MDKIKNVWVFSDKTERSGEIIGGAREIGEKVICFARDQNEAKTAFSFGVDEVFICKEGGMIENLALSIVKMLQDQSGVILMPNTKRCKAMASILGAQLKAGVSTETGEIEISSGAVKCQRIMYGGLAIGTEKISSKIAIVLINSGVFAPPSTLHSEKEAKILEFVEPKACIKCIKKMPKLKNSVDLSKAKRIVAIGRGIVKEEDIAIARQLCEAINAELGCSRPIAEGEKWMEHERYIGISSVTVKPVIYVSIGISGQIQHMVGVKDAGRILVINKDANAPIFDYADYGIVGDLYKVVPRLIEALK